MIGLPAGAGRPTVVGGFRARSNNYSGGFCAGIDAGVKCVLFVADDGVMTKFSLGMGNELPESVGEIRSLEASGPACS